MKNTNSKSGGALVLVMIVLLTFSVLSIGLFKLHETDAVEAVYAEQTDQAFWVAEAGLQRALNKLRSNTIYRKGLSDDPNNPDIETGAVGNGSYTNMLWGDGSDNNFWIRSHGSVMGNERLLGLYAVLNEFGSHGLVTLNGDSRIMDGGTINGSIYQNGELTTRGDVTITGDVLADNYEDFGSQGTPIPEDGYIDMSIDQDYFNTYLSMSATGTLLTDPLNLNNNTVVINPVNKNSSPGTINGPGTLVIKGGQVFGSDLTVGDNVTIIVDGDLTISKNGSLGSNVTLFATGAAELFKNATADVETGTGCAIFSLGDMDIRKELTFNGIIFTEGTLTARKDLTVNGTIITGTGFELRKDATVTFNDGFISANARENMISLTFIVNESFWSEFPVN